VSQEVSKESLNDALFHDGFHTHQEAHSCRHQTAAPKNTGWKKKKKKRTILCFSHNKQQFIRGHSRSKRHGHILECLRSVDNQQGDHNKQQPQAWQSSDKPTPHGEQSLSTGQQATTVPLMSLRWLGLASLEAAHPGIISNQVLL
jgi:ADP-heptose:LPS heptosyltransferase